MRLETVHFVYHSTNTTPTAAEVKHENNPLRGRALIRPTTNEFRCVSIR